MYVYETKGVCAKQIEFDIEGNRIKHVSFIGGCSGNLKGLSKLLEGITVEDAIAKLKGIDCRGKGTSCPDQLVNALESHLKKSTL